MPTMMPIDKNGEEIPVLGFRTGGGQNISISGTSAKNATAFNDDTRVVTVYSTVAVKIAQAEATTGLVATSNDGYIPANTMVDVAIGGNGIPLKKFMALIAADGSSTGTAYLSERE